MHVDNIVSLLHGIALFILGFKANKIFISRAKPTFFGLQGKLNIM